MALIQQKYEMQPIMWLTTRLIYLTTVTMTFICFQMYSASLTSVFTAEIFVPSISSLQVHMSYIEQGSQYPTIYSCAFE